MAMEKRRSSRRIILAISLLLNAALLATLAYREVFRGIDRFTFTSESTNWARYAGKMQAHADFGNRVRRIYRPTPATSPNDRDRFTGEREGEAEIWTWLYFPQSESSELTVKAYSEAYNRRMRGYIAAPTSYEPHGTAASSK